MILTCMMHTCMYEHMYVCMCDTYMYVLLIHAYMYECMYTCMFLHFNKYDV